MSVSLSAVAAAALTSACAAAGAWWWHAFRRGLPLERKERALRAELGDLREFAGEILDLETAVRHPARALEEVAGRALGALHRRRPELTLAAFVRRPDGSATLLAHRGGPWARLELSSFRFDRGLLARATECGRDVWRLGAGDPDDPLASVLTGQGFVVAAASSWSDAQGAGVVLAVGSGSDDDLERLAPRLELAAAALRQAAALATDLSDLTSSQDKLEGGLTAAMEELDEAHDRLIVKSKHIRTLHDVAGALTARAAQAPSTLAAIVSIVARALEADLVAFLILDEATGELVNEPGALGLEGAVDLMGDLPLGEERSSAVRVLQTLQPFVTGDAQNDPSPVARDAKMWRVHSLMLVPLVLGNRCIGVMRVGSKRRNAFSDEQIALVSVIAGEAAIIVETAILNRRLTQTAEQLATLNRMKDEFVATVSHEFKTPLTTISGFLNVMLEGEAGALNAQQMKFMTIVQSAAKRLAELVSDLLDLSRLEGGVKMESNPLDLGRLVAEAVERHQPAAKSAGKRLSTEAPALLPRALGDGRWLDLVVDNLVSNAIKFTHSGGRVRVRLQDKGEFLMVSVSDDGIGVPPADREKIFERFYRAGNCSEVNASGTGLGLALAREVVVRHGGKIWLESDLGKGTIFHFVVPAAARETAQ